MALATVKGAVMLAALRYLQTHCREADVEEARARARSLQAEEVILASRWYPRVVLHAFEDVAQRCSRAASPFSKRGFGSYISGDLLQITYANLRKDNPKGMASALPLLFSCVFTDLKCRSKSESGDRCTFTVDGVGLSQRDQDVYTGMIEGAMTLAGAAEATTEVQPVFNGSPLIVVIRWGLVHASSVWEKIQVKSEYEIIESRDKARRLASAMGFGTVDVIGLATCISELARNIVNYAGEGTILIEDTSNRGSRCLKIRAEDRGPGIANLEEVMSGNFRSQKGLGMGLVAIKKLSDEFKVESHPGAGTTIEIVKYLNKRA
jgi:serine/threonine-protein kinase RsbT